LFGLLITYHIARTADIGVYIRDDIERQLQAVDPQVGGWQTRGIPRRKWFRIIAGYLPIPSGQ